MILNSQYVEATSYALNELSSSALFTLNTGKTNGHGNKAIIAPGSGLVGDAWQGKGIGLSLLERCMAIAEKQGYKTVYGIVPVENRNMLALGRKLGSGIGKDPDSSVFNLVIHFGKIEPETRGQLKEKG